ncbi:hypothetical protein [Sphingomonas sp. CCH15-F11]|uniref:hypothetical protein n=1 Tax=Sphingomonas sp. CCH15-F11 TaxID=1768785 RepID=UPI000AB5804C|nr:hypothetical protein [Sphingomonas sp. CCH15-F11]
MLAFYLGGVVATAGILFGESIADSDPLDVGFFLCALGWPVFIAMFFIDMIRQRS